jgi:HSP20 family protein
VSPPVDIEKTEDAYVIEVIEAELHGVKREDGNINLVGANLQITGEIKRQDCGGRLR